MTKRRFIAYKLWNGKYTAALYDPDRNLFYRSMTTEESRATGAHTYCAKDPAELGGTYPEYDTLSAAQHYANERNKLIDTPPDP